MVGGRAAGRLPPGTEGLHAGQAGAAHQVEAMTETKGGTRGRPDTDHLESRRR